MALSVGSNPFFSTVPQAVGIAILSSKRTVTLCLSLCMYPLHCMKHIPTKLLEYRLESTQFCNRVRRNIAVTVHQNFDTSLFHNKLK